MDDMFSQAWLPLLFQMQGEIPPSKNSDTLFDAVERRFSGLIKQEPWQKYEETWTITKPKYLADYWLQKRNDSLFLAPGPLVKTKFAVASLDSPVCNFGRMPPPPPIGNPAWKDTLLLAVGDSVLIDGFYVHFPWVKKWAKVIFTQKLARSPGKVEINLAHVFADAGDTTSFFFWSGNDAYNYSDRKKCLTKAEQMWKGEYKTHFRQK